MGLGQYMTVMGNDGDTMVTNGNYIWVHGAKTRQFTVSGMVVNGRFKPTVTYG